MPHASSPRPLPRIGPMGARRWLAFALALLLIGAGASWSRAALAQGVELSALELRRAEGELDLDFAARLTLSRSIEDALQRGVPMYFVAQATVYRNRWYWRDERVARVTRQWRLSYQPLTGTWRVGLGALAQSHATLSEALVMVSRASGWRLADVGALDPDSRHYVEFSYRLDSSQLPRPLQIGVGSEWQLGIERTLRVPE